MERLATMATMEQAFADMMVAFGFDFNGSRWVVVVRRDATLTPSRLPRVDVFEDGEAVGTGYLGGDDDDRSGPMFDASHLTPLGGCSLEAWRDGGDHETDGEDEFGEAILDAWGKALLKAWDAVRPAYLAMKK